MTRRMIKALQIKNFQSHKESDLSFDKGVNIIVGSSDSGKSAILRAIRWLVYNRPTGDAFRSNWGGQTKVIIDTDDAIITRLKDKENKYVLGDTHFEALRTDVPQEIQEALNLTDLNIQTQLEMPFLLSQSSGEVASFFNRIAGLDKIDLATANVNKWIREITSDINYKTQEEVRLTEELAKFEHLEKFEAEVEVLEGMENRYKQLCRRDEALQELIFDIGLVDTDIKDKSKILQFENSVNNLLVLYEKERTVQDQMDNLFRLFTKITTIQDRIEYHQFNISSEKAVDNILQLIGKRKSLVEARNTLAKAITMLNNTNTKLKQESISATRLRAKFDEEMGDVCILCGQTIKNLKV